MTWAETWKYLCLSQHTAKCINLDLCWNKIQQALTTSPTSDSSWGKVRAGHHAPLVVVSQLTVTLGGHQPVVLIPAGFHRQLNPLRKRGGRDKGKEIPPLWLDTIPSGANVGFLLFYRHHVHKASSFIWNHPCMHCSFADTGALKRKFNCFDLCAVYILYTNSMNTKKNKE